MITVYKITAINQSVILDKVLTINQLISHPTTDIKRKRLLHMTLWVCTKI